MTDTPARICVSGKYFCSCTAGCPAILHFRTYPWTQHNLKMYAKNCCKFRLRPITKEEKHDRQART